MINQMELQLLIIRILMMKAKVQLVQEKLKKVRKVRLLVQEEQDQLSQN
jgi:hypothetical protein